jgi:UTP--glucose-1-phosphate uridylyltransferase
VRITDAVIPVAGLGTRLLPATRSQPKEMLPVLDKPVVQYVVEELVAAGIQRVLFVTGRRKRAIEDHFDADPELGSGPLIDALELELFYTRQARPAGLGDALRYGATFADGHPVVVALGDSIIANPSITGRLMDAYADDVVAAIGVETVPDEAVQRYGIVIGSARADGTIEVEQVLEKPLLETVESRLAVAARYVLGPEVFAALRDTRPDATGEIQVADALNTVIAQGGRVVALHLADGERRHDIGTVESYCSAFLEFALADPRVGPGLRARLS